MHVEGGPTDSTLNNKLAGASTNRVVALGDSNGFVVVVENATLITAGMNDENMTGETSC